MVIFFQEREQKRHQDLQANLPAIKYVQTVHIITTRMEKKLDENQPREHAGFRSKYSTTDHIHAINQLKGALYRIGCVGNRLGDSGVKVL